MSWWASSNSSALARCETSPVCSMKAGLPGMALTLAMPSLSVARASGLAGLAKPTWLSEICTKEKPLSSALASPISREVGTPPPTVQTTPLPAQTMHSRTCRRSNLALISSILHSCRGRAPLAEWTRVGAGIFPVDEMFFQARRCAATAGETRTQSRPSNLAWYSAASARRIRRSRSLARSRSGAEATPTLTVTMSYSLRGVGDVEGAHRLADALAEGAAAVGAGSGAQHRELLAAVAHREIGRAAHLPLDRRGDLAQAVVAGEVAIGVVVALEAVDIDHDEAGRGLAAAGALLLR